MTTFTQINWLAVVVAAFARWSSGSSGIYRRSSASDGLRW